MEKKERGHLDLLCDLGELSNLLTSTDDIEIFLQQAVELVSRHLDAPVCSIYLYEETTRELVLKATIGLNPHAVEKIRIKLDEGLVGLCMTTLEPILEGDAWNNPNFKYFVEAEEDRFSSLLAIPIKRGVEKIGVLVVQHEKKDFFDEIDLMGLRALAAQLAGAIENAHFLIDLHQQNGAPARKTVPEDLRFIKADIGSPGYAFAPSMVFTHSHDRLLTGDPGTEIPLTLADFHKALRATTDQLKYLQSTFAARLPESASLIFSAHFMILKDPQFVGKMIQLINNGVSPLEAVRIMALKYIDVFSSSPHAYIREKVNDVEDLSLRLLRNLLRKDIEKSMPAEKKIVIAADLYPSDILKLASDEVKGIILVSGSVTSHVTILARSLKIPMMIADKSELLNLPDGKPILIDAEIGSIYIDPSKEIIQQFETRNQTLQEAAPLIQQMNPQTHLLDGTRITLLANINLLSELTLAKDLKAEGVGLYRTEFPFLIRSMFPSEEEQVGIYNRLIDEMGGREVTIRTLDVGGDKVLSYSDASKETNPQLGLRSIRFTLKHRDIFQQQVRAILRAAAHADRVRIMFPMISSLDEFLEAKQLVAECIRSLDRQNLPHHPGPPIGMMVELPSVLGILDDFARDADFFSIGTNDFIQYMLAADRTNRHVADYYQPWHPSILRGLAAIARSANDAGKSLSVCGEVARDPDYLPFLIGIGIRSISLDPQFLPQTQKRLQQLDRNAAERFAHDLLSQTTIKGVQCAVEAARTSLAFGS